MKIYRKLVLVLVPVLVLSLSACGTLQISLIDPSNQAASQTPPAENPIAVMPSSSVTPTFVLTPAPSPTPTLTPQPPLNLPLRLEPGERLSIQRTYMFDANQGWAVGHGQASAMDHILRTTDGGQNWKEVTPPRLLAQSSLVYNLALTYITDLRHAWVMYTTQDPSPLNTDSLVWTTSDGGLSWTQTKLMDYSSLPVETLMPSSIGYSDPDHGWVMAHLGGGMSQDFVALFTTADGGQTWKRMVDPGMNNLGMGCTKTGVVFTTPERGWIIGNCGGALPGVFIYQTDDGGQTWAEVTLPDPLSRKDIYKKPENICGADSISFVTPQIGWLLVRCSLTAENETRAWLYATRDAGLTWAPYGLPTPYGSYDFYNGQMGWWLGAASADPNEAAVSLFYTRDSGLTWNVIISPGWTGTPDFVDAQTGWVVARTGDRNALVYTNSGGRTWKQLKAQAGP